ncbi:MAG: AMP-binding protein [Gammaproteobacteria bacterium]|nr:AMP-binding protein [Gammaproteobacteria bacterium]
MDPTPHQRVEHLLKLVQALLVESGREHAVSHLTLKADLTQDLGIDSLGRVELFLRIEKTFGVHLPDFLMAEAKTLEDLAKAIEDTKPTGLKSTEASSRASLLEPIALDVSSAKTLGEVVFRYAHETPTRPHIYLQDELGRETIIRYEQLFEAAARIARGLSEIGVKSGETVAIMLPTSEGFFYSFFGILLLGAIPVPIYPPFRSDQIEEYVKREAKILQNAEVRVLITFDKAVIVSRILRAFIPSLLAVETVQELMRSGGVLPPVHIEENDPALIQYTSGSTSIPKGVLLSHKNLLTNVRSIGQAIHISPTDVAVSWLPLYHDMGLIGSWLFALYHGIPIIILSPISFLTRPERWLWAIHAHRGTLSAAPNFAYELCIRKIDEHTLEGLDLSSWRLALNGAEAVSPKTLHAFVKKFSKCGFKEETFFPVYGLAESTVALTFPTPGRAPRIDKIDRKAFEQERRAEPKAAHQENGLEFVGCGHPLPGHDVRIVDESGTILKERQIGMLQFKGPSSMCGYYRNPAATDLIRHEGAWWDSGDLAYLGEGDVFITGRIKDIIIKAGRNVHPEELEDIASTIKGIRRGCVVAFGATDPLVGTEKIVIVAETAERESSSHDQMISAIIHKVAEATEIPPDIVILVPPRTIPKTSSGKLRRGTCKELYLKGELSKERWSSGFQLTRLIITSLKKYGLRSIQNIIKVAYTLYSFLLIIIAGSIAWGALSVSTPKRARSFLKILAHGLCVLTGCPIRMKGKVHLFYEHPMIFVANHTSYVDVIALLAILPADTRFVGKKELLQLPVIGSLLKKLGLLTIDRLDFSQSLQDAECIEKAVREGSSVLIFPEGTFTYATGLRPFKFGAFKIAVDTKRPILPIALTGPRSILRSGSYLLTPHWIDITVLPPIVPTGHDWHEIVRLHTMARSAIAQHCGEPIIDLITAGIP